MVSSLFAGGRVYSAAVFPVGQSQPMRHWIRPAQMRSLSATEQEEVQKGLSLWIPKSYKTPDMPLFMLLASPIKSAILWGAVTSPLGACVGSMVNLRVAGLGSVIAALIGAFNGFNYRQEQNNTILKLMMGLPRNPTKRDRLSFPYYQPQWHGSASPLGLFPPGSSRSSSSGSCRVKKV